MQIVIDIPNDAYNLLKTSGVDWLGAEHILNAVANGTPLPKGHGRLVDADKLLEKAHWNENDILVVNERDIYHAPTIIEADKESEDKG